MRAYFEEPQPLLVQSVTLVPSEMHPMMDEGEARQAMLGDLTRNESLVQAVESIRERRDRRGRPIIKGLKQHKVSFRDEVCPGQQIYSVSVVDNYKAFNVDVSMGPSQKCCRVL